MDNHWYNPQKVSVKRRNLNSIGIGFAFFVVLYALTKLFSVSLCPVKALFGISCFGCGMTRGFISILNFDFKTAFEYNTLSIPLFVGVSVYSLLSLIDFFFDKKYVCIVEKQLAKKYMYWIYSAILIMQFIGLM